MSELALLGGKPVLADKLPAYPSIGEAEKKAVMEVLDSGCLSGFYGSPGPEFLGGPKVREFEAAWAAKFGCKHAVSVNANTSGLIAAVGAIGVSPGDEVIVPAWTMSATAMAPLIYGGIPVFVDVEPETFCLDVAKVGAELTPRTRAIIAVNLFGHPAELTELRKLADSKGIFLIEDTAQAPLAFENGKPAGTIGHIGVFSFNYHKHIHTGEGGMCVTDDDGLAMRLQMIRNHAENLVESYKIDNPVNLIGFNFRITEMSAAVGLAQLADIDRHVGARERVAQVLTAACRELHGIKPPHVRDGCRHNYYVWMTRYDARTVGVSRATYSAALTAEGFPHEVGYLRPLYMLPVFQKRTAIGRDHWPFSLSGRDYADGACPVVEKLHADEALWFEPCAYDIDDIALAKLCEAFRKVHRHRHDLITYDRRNAG